jgi:hypothetical protein
VVVVVERLLEQVMLDYQAVLAVAVALTPVQIQELER